MTSNRLNLLGVPQFYLASGKKLTLPSRKGWGVIAYLATNPDHEISREEVAHLLWGNSGEEHARASLRQELATTKKILSQHGLDPILATKDSLKFSSETISTDLAEFAALSNNQDAAELKLASSLYEGEFLQGLSIRSEPFENWVCETRRYFEKVEINNLTKIIDAAKAGETDAAIVEAANKIISLDDSQENAYCELMIYYAGIGRRTEALRQFNLCKEALQQSLDAVPSARTQALADNIRSMDPTAPSPSPVVEQPAVSQSTSSTPQQQQEPALQTAAAATLSSNSTDDGSSSNEPIRNIGTSRRNLFLKAALVAIGLPLAIGFIQYFSAGQKITSENLLCSLPFVDKAKTNSFPIDAILPFDKSFGKRQEWGIRKFLQDHRNDYQFDITIKFHDSKSDHQELDKILTGLEKSKPVAILGPMQSRLAYDAKNWGNKTKTPIVSSLASASYLTSLGVQDYFFRVGMSDGIRAEALVDWMRLKNLHNNPYILHEWAPATPGLDEPEIYGASQASAVKKHLGKATSLRFLRGDKPSQLEAIDKVKNDGRAIAIFGYTSNIKYIIAELQDRGVQNDLFLMGVVTTELEKANYPFPDKLHVVTGIVSEASHLTNSDKLRQEFVDENPDLEYDLSAYYAYDSTAMVMDAIKFARDDSCFGQVTGESVAHHLRQTPTKRRKLVTGGFLADTQEIFFNSDGLKIVDGKFQHVGIGN